MKVRICRLALAFVAGLAIVTSPWSARAGDPADDISELSADERERLKSLIETGRTAYEEGDFERSLAKFRQARDMLEHPDFVYRIALAHDRLGNVREAIEAYRQFLEMAPEAEERGKVERTIRELEQRLESRQPTLEITTIPTGAEVFVDAESEPRGTTTMTLPIEPGTHQLRLSKQGFQVAERTVEVSPGETVSMQVELREKETGVASEDEPSRTDRAGAGLGPIITIGTSGLLTVGAIVSYTRFAHFRGEVSNHKSCTPNCLEPDGFDADADSQKSWEAAAWTFGSLAAATATAGGVWMALSGDHPPAGGTHADRRPVIAPMVGSDRIGLQIRFHVMGGPR